MRRGKFNNKPVTVDGHRFASKAEAKRYGELKLLEKAGKIRDLQLQVRFPLGINNKLICAYIADFRYYDINTSRYIVADVKGVRTPVYRIKKKLMKAIYGIDITEIQA